MNRKILNFLLVIVLLLGGGTSFLYAQGKNTYCPVMPGSLVKEKFYVDYRGERIYLCCRACEKAFKKNPERYLKNLK